jgi:hypothetical protein
VCTLCPVMSTRPKSIIVYKVEGHARLTTGPMRSSSEGLVRTFELGAACAGTGRESATTVRGGRGAAGGGGDAAEAVGLGASQVPAGTREAAAALPTVFWTVGPDDGEEKLADGRGAEGMAGLGAVGVAALRKAAMSTFPTGV